MIQRVSFSSVQFSVLSFNIIDHVPPIYLSLALALVLVLDLTSTSMQSRHKNNIIPLLKFIILLTL